ncbi:hypothetical protein ILUMI_26185 [Ignelater luminosus]|uniref:Integrase catalytic domain-containing protein n=1 Tax=Ignelater luminosus TaxID=2038154 RepID=A0A8K0C8Z5_IGNLU|nr:hypothetical protein ILUMI_26185 [Ignelater luminosus]
MSLPLRHCHGMRRAARSVFCEVKYPLCCQPVEEEFPTELYKFPQFFLFFTVIDLKGACQQLQSDLTASGIFQLIMEAILAGLPNIKCYLDDIFVYSTILQECHLDVLKVMNRFNDYNEKVNEERIQKKGKFLADADGLSRLPISSETSDIPDPSYSFNLADNVSVHAGDIARVTKKIFCQANGIKPVKTPPYHPQSNGIAKSRVQTIKKGLEKSLCLEKGKRLRKMQARDLQVEKVDAIRNEQTSMRGACAYGKNINTERERIKDE